MSATAMPPDRATLIASLRDYVEQIREEGLEGLEGHARRDGVAAAPTAARTPARAAAVTSRSVAAPTQGVAPAAPAAAAKETTPAPTSAARLFATNATYLYPELEKTTDLAALREFIGECTR